MTVAQTANVDGLVCSMTEINQVELNSVEVKVLWQGSVKEVFQRPITLEKKPLDFTVGEDPSSDYIICSEYSNGDDRFSLIAVQEGVPVVNIPRGASGNVAVGGAPLCNLVEFKKQGGIVTESERRTSVALSPGAKVIVVMGPYTFVMSLIASEARPEAAGFRGFRPNWFTGVSLMLHVLFFGMISLVPPDSHGLIMDPENMNNRYAKYMLTPKEVTLSALEKPTPVDEKDAPKMDPGQEHTGVKGQAGDRKAPNRNTKYGLKGPKDNQHVAMAKEEVKQTAAQAGILGLLPANTPTSPFGSDNPMGQDPENALGHLTGDNFGNAFGYGGLHVAGTGRGGGGNGYGSIGMGDLGLNKIGRTYGRIGGSGGPGHDGAFKKRQSKGPRIVSKTASVKGSLSKSVIRRMIHRKINEVKFCYERGLAKRPDMAGRVTVRFIIDRNGGVKMAAIDKSTIGNQGVEQCIRNVVTRITFPQPEDAGIVIVSYPFSLSSTDY